jgi:hypothetical protein
MSSVSSAIQSVPVIHKIVEATMIARQAEEIKKRVARMQRPDFQTGMIFPQWGTAAYSTQDANWTIGLRDIQQQTGAQWIGLPINLFQPALNSTQIMAAEMTPTPEAILEGIRAAHAMGYKVFVIPLLTVAGPLGSITTWAGSIQFSSLQQTQLWFANYWQAVRPYAVAAAQAKAEQMAIGTEYERLQLVSPSLWNQLINNFHSVFPGALTYDMNWSSLGWALPRWMHNQYLTHIGVSVYVPLTDIPERLPPTELPTLWQQKAGILLDSFAARLGRPIFISEFGYRDSTDTLYKPWIWQTQAPPDPQEQAGVYNALLTNIIRDPAITGVYAWGWSVPVYQPNWKPAAQVLYKWYTSPLA